MQRTNRGILPCDVEEEARKSMDELEERVFRAYFRGRRYRDQPSNGVEWVEHEGRLYAVLSNVNGILAVYRVKKDGSLKGINAEWFEKRVYNKEN